MSFRVAAAMLLLTAAFAGLPLSRAAASDSPPMCYDPATGVEKPATKWLTAPGKLVGTNGPDVLVGVFGDDIILGMGGNDIICSAPTLTDSMPDTPNNTVDGGSGNDSISVRGLGAGGSGNDTISVNVGTAQGGSGTDTIYIGFGTADGGSGPDTIYTVGDGAVYGGSGGDTIVNQGGDPRIDCGSGFDTVSPNGATSFRRCEILLD